MGNFIPNLFCGYAKDGFMKINFNNKRPEFIKYIIAVLEDHNSNDSVVYERSHGSLIVHNIEYDTALEIDCEGTKLNLYYFHAFSDDAISFCDELDLNDPESINSVMKWLDKVDNPKLLPNVH